MIRFECDYNNGCAPEILTQILASNEEQTPGYGIDAYCSSAAKKIRRLCGDEEAQISFFVGATQANLTVIAAALRPYQGVIAAHTGHISVHESGAIEATGHKVLTIKSDDSKLQACQVEAYCMQHYSDPTYEHMVQPGMVYISFPTESGMLYSREELLALRAVCDAYHMVLFVDGARLGYGLAAEDNDVTLADLTSITDAFYIGGTKVGAMFGEAVVVSNNDIKKSFKTVIKQRGALLAKGRLLGIQFDTLFTNDLYSKLSKHAVHEAMRIQKALVSKGIPLMLPSTTNQQFPVLTSIQADRLNSEFAISFWERVDEEHTVYRICTSWATKSDDTDALIRAIESL